MSQAPGGNKSGKGFTLLEVLLSTVLFSFIALIVYSVFSNGMRIEARSSKVFAVCREAGLALNLISREVENAFNYDLAGSYPGEVSFFGTADRLRFVNSSGSGIECIEYFLGLPSFGVRIQTLIGKRTGRLESVVASRKEEDLRQFLIRRQTPYPMFLASGKQGGEDEIIASGVIKGTLKFQYASVPDDQSSGNVSAAAIEWKDSWEDATLPLAVRVEMRFWDENNPQGPGILMSREIVLPVPADALRKAGALAGNGIRHTLDIRHLDSVKELKQ